MTNKRLTFGLALILTLILLGSVAAGLYISNQLSQASKGEFLWESKEKADYHLMVILDASNQAYGEEFSEGLMDAAKDYKIAAEIIKVDGSNYNEDVLDVLDMAMYAKVDGIVIHAFDNKQLIEKIQYINNTGIPVITLNEDLASSMRISYVGVNRYNIGQEAGKALVNAINGPGKIAVIEQKGYADSYSTTDDLLILGLKDVLKGYNKLSLETVMYTERGVLSAETVATKILRENPEINGIFCTDGQNTLGVVQVLLDNNLVGDVTLVGYGDDEEILNYLEKGNIIEASIITDYEDVGREAIRAFYEYKTQSFVSNYINTALQVVNEDNIKQYRSEMSDDHGKDE